MRMLAAALAALVLSSMATDAAALTTVNCSADATEQLSTDWDALTYITPTSPPYRHETASLEATLSLRRSCGREYRGTLTVRGSTVRPIGYMGPEATIAKRASNACSVSASSSNTFVLPFGYPMAGACGANVVSTWVKDGVSYSEVSHDGCEGESHVPSESSVTTTNDPGCYYPPENDASSMLQVPALTTEPSSCNGYYDVSWENVPGATRYVLMRKLANQQTDIYTTLYDGPNNYFTTFVSSSSQSARLWVRACAGTVCGFHSGPRLITYYAGCP